MYAPKSFREERLPVLHDFIRANAFAAVVSAGFEELEASHVPLILDQGVGELGVLRGHLSRANRHWEQLRTSVALAIFQGPHAYVSPSWYPSKQEHGRVVPTWDYLAVHARGAVRTFDDAPSLRALLEALTNQYESQRDAPWKVGDAPDDYTANAMRGIVGFEIAMARIEGVWKMSQNRPPADRAGVVEGLREGSPMDREVADWVELLGEEK